MQEPPDSKRARRKPTLPKPSTRARLAAGVAQTPFVVMGEVLAAYGVQGWLKVRAFTASPAGLLGYRTWWLQKDANAAWRQFSVLESRPHGQAIVARLEGVSVREDALQWRGAEIAVPRADLPAASAGEVYLADLVGLAVANREGATLGRVAGLIETGAHPVLRVADEGETGERLIPLVPAYVDTIDLTSGRMVVDWPSES